MTQGRWTEKLPASFSIHTNYNYTFRRHIHHVVPLHTHHERRYKEDSKAWYARAQRVLYNPLIPSLYRIIFVWKMCAPRTRAAARWDTLRVCVCAHIFIYGYATTTTTCHNGRSYTLACVCVWAGGRFGRVVNRWTTWIYLMGPSCSRDGWCPLYFRGGCGLRAHTRGRGIKNDAALYSPLEGACHRVAAATIHVRV